MRLAHPRPKLVPAAHSWRVRLHPGLEVLGAYPARVQLAECAEEGGCFGLQLGRGIGGVGCGDGV